MEKQTVDYYLALILGLAEQPPGFKASVYDGAEPLLYRRERALVQRQLRDARRLAQYIAKIPQQSAMARHLSGAIYTANRVKISETLPTKLHYIIGQYRPVEYRRAACDILARAIRLFHYDSHGLGCGQVRELMEKQVGRTIARRWFE